MFVLFFRMKICSVRATTVLHEVHLHIYNNAKKKINKHYNYGLQQNKKFFVFRFFSIFRFSAKNGGRKMKNGFSSFFAPFCPKFWLFLVIFSKYHNVFSITHSAYLKKMKKNEENPYLEIFCQKFFKNGSNFDDFSR